ncbi:MAG: 4Fe-4S binding protein [Synergistaceae bacterium]|jgi:NAD-dependent dihydropyrimidine dehydrogenase PreA subunit|nr:4Fe-4S binding protein [Synergistaceae bacterium]
MQTELRYLKNVSTLSLDPKRCVGCGMCLTVCPRSVFLAEDAKVKIEDRDACIECGACVLNCPVSALSVHPGVGCASAIINGLLSGGEAECTCC